MPITNITHSAGYTIEMGVSAGDLTRITLDNNHTAHIHICLQGISCVCVKNYPPEIMQPSSSTPATIVSAENQNGATIVKATFFFCHYYIVWKSNNAVEARGQSWSESLKSRWIPGGSCGYTSGTKRKHFAAISSPWPCWRWLQLQPSCGSPHQCIGPKQFMSTLKILDCVAWGQSWSESLKSRWIPGGSCGYTSGTKRKHFAAISSPWPCWRWLQLQPSCGSPHQCIGPKQFMSTLKILDCL